MNHLKEFGMFKIVIILTN